MQAMILAAGLGTRLLPHTSIRPKPLFPVLNSPLLLLTIARLKNFGFDHIIVNCHHLREQIVEAVELIEDVMVIEEEIILGTGGGLRGAVTTSRSTPTCLSAPTANGSSRRCAKWPRVPASSSCTRSAMTREWRSSTPSATCSPPLSRA